MPTSTSLNLRALLKVAADRSGLSVPSRRFTGLTPQAQALYVATLAQSRAGDLVFVVVPTDADVEQMTTDVRFFTAALEGAGDAVVERLVLPLPSRQVDPYRGMAPHFRVASARARALHAMASGAARTIVASAAALLPRVAEPQRLTRSAIELRPGMDIDPLELAELLAGAGFTREDPVDEHGEFGLRGGILDVYPAADAQPVRIEFIGDTVESMRRYDPATQRSTATVDRVAIEPLRDDLDAEDQALATVIDYLNAHPSVVILSEAEEIERQAARHEEQIQASYADAQARRGTAPSPDTIVTHWAPLAERFRSAIRIEQLAIDDPAAPGESRHVRSQPASEFKSRIPDWVGEIRRLREAGETVLFVAGTPGRAERTVEILADYELIATELDQAEDVHRSALLVVVGSLTRGFRLPDAFLQIYAEPDIFEEERRTTTRKRSYAQTFLSDLRELKVGDLIVHVDHGIGEFVGLKQIAIGPGADTIQEFLEVRYAGEDKLFVPVERLDLVQKYSGATRPALDRMGGTTWERAKSRVRKAMRDMAEELLKLYAARQAVPGHAFTSDTHWQQEFEDAFEYELTPDQRSAIADIKRDMESPTPMDRLLCGDVGYGKTEVAMRAAFKAVMDGKQVAFLAPTTVLAFQHHKTLRERFAGFPVNIEMVSRFRSKAEQKQVLADLAAGKVDVIVGTHRLLSKDVVFRDLGLLVVDEEQRFGVTHKERIKQLRRKVDVLTMSATPIPRTLNMSLVGIRDMSIIETPPKDRLSIQTNVVKFDAQVIARAIRTELERGGQVYFVHNRVESIFSIGNLIARLVPEARLVVAHGQMAEDELERAMLDFMARKFDILLATTIIENGLDIPNVNTIVVNRADRYGLSQLYQLRGRVGRSDRPAYAYLLIPPEDVLSPVAKKRLAAIKEFSDLGSGFRVAALDLEIRGAGNLLGGEQSGHIEAVGFEMYMKLLEQAVRELKGEELEDDVRAVVNLRVDLRIDAGYIPDMNQRLIVYRKIAAARSEGEIDTALAELRDRYGPLPDSALNLAEYGRIRVAADRLGIESIDREAQTVVIKFRPQTRVDPAALVRIVGQRADVTLSPPAAVKIDLKRPAGGESAAARGASPTPAPPGSRVLGRGKAPARSPQGAPGWWTARATTGAVEPGFTKAEILRPQKEDPRGPDGVFTRVHGLLSALLKVS
jgi:transcription-repair coupling factor (superfamily II helicase)